MQHLKNYFLSNYFIKKMKQFQRI